MKTVVLGMNNPHSLLQSEALHPKFPNSAGSRLYDMVRLARPETTVEEFVSLLDLRNLCLGRRWDLSEARAAAGAAWHGLMDRRVVVLGRHVQMALGLTFCGWFTWDTVDDEGQGRTDYCVVPHPSGLCRLYNDPSVRQRVGKTVSDEMVRHTSGFTSGA